MGHCGLPSRLDDPFPSRGEEAGPGRDDDDVDMAPAICPPGSPLLPNSLSIPEEPHRKTDERAAGPADQHPRPPPEAEQHPGGAGPGRRRSPLVQIDEEEESRSPVGCHQMRQNHPGAFLPHPVSAPSRQTAEPPLFLREGTGGEGRVGTAAGPFVGRAGQDRGAEDAPLLPTPNMTEMAMTKSFAAAMPETPPELPPPVPDEPAPIKEPAPSPLPPPMPHRDPERPHSPTSEPRREPGTFPTPGPAPMPPPPMEPTMR